MADANAKDNIVEETIVSDEETLNADTSIEETPEESAEEKMQKELDQLKDKLMRHAAEFDNYKKRTSKEREDLYAMSVCDTIEKILPVKDNLERAVNAIESSDEEKSLADGVAMILKQLDEVFASIGIEPIKAVGEIFDPELHNAVMHEENEEFGENTISEELMKGYIYKQQRVVRHSMVKVAN